MPKVPRGFLNLLGGASMLERVALSDRQHMNDKIGSYCQEMASGGLLHFLEEGLTPGKVVAFVQKQESDCQEVALTPGKDVAYNRRQKSDWRGVLPGGGTWACSQRFPWGA